MMGTDETSGLFKVLMQLGLTRDSSGTGRIMIALKREDLHHDERLFLIGDGLAKCGAYERARAILSNVVSSPSGLVSDQAASSIEMSRLLEERYPGQIVPPRIEYGPWLICINALSHAVAIRETPEPLVAQLTKSLGEVAVGASAAALLAGERPVHLDVLETWLTEIPPDLPEGETLRQLSDRLRQIYLACAKGEGS